MKSAVFYGKHNMRVEESPMPKVGAEDVLIPSVSWTGYSE